MKMRYSLRSLLILMLLVGPLCIWGWPAYESWRDERARVAKEEREIKRVQQRIAILDQQCRIAGGNGGPALTGTETIEKLLLIELELQQEFQLIQVRVQIEKLTQQVEMRGGLEANEELGIVREIGVPGVRSIDSSVFPLHFEGTEEELREHLGQGRKEKSQP